MKSRDYFDLHIHTQFSDGKLSLSEIIDLYGKRKFSAIAITDHLADEQTLTGYVTQRLKLSLNKDNFDSYLEEIHFQKKRAWDLYNMLVIPGVEITLNSWKRDKGAHLLFLNVSKFIDPNHSVEDILRNNRDCFSIAAHPIWEEAYEFKTTYLWKNRFQLQNDFDAWECATGSHFSKEVFLSQYPIVASSDYHGSSHFESWKSYTYLDDRNTENLFTNIRHKKIEPIWY